MQIIKKVSKTTVCNLCIFYLHSFEYSFIGKKTSLYIHSPFDRRSRKSPSCDEGALGFLLGLLDRYVSVNYSLVMLGFIMGFQLFKESSSVVDCLNY